jgi:aspartate/methionine/tyrosine aminotransferase
MPLYREPPMHLNDAVTAIPGAPIAQAASWIRKEPSNLAFISLSQAVPSYPPAPALRAEIARLAGLDETSGYTDVTGIPPLRAAIAERMAEETGDVTADDVAVTAGCNQAFCAAVSALAAPGDNVILPLPWYFNHQMWIDMQKIGLKPLHVDPATALPDPAAAARLIDSRTRAIVLVTPNNPTGATYPGGLIEAFFTLARDHGIALIVDETYRDYLPPGEPPHRLFERPDWRDTLIQLYSFSKVYALAGYRVGSIVAGPRLIASVEKLVDCMAICAPRIAQGAALYGLDHLAGWKDEKRSLMDSRRAALIDAFARPDLRFSLVSSGAYFAYVRHPFGEAPGTAESFAKRLAHEQNMLVLPGSMFGPGQESFLRLAFANVEGDLMREVAARFVAVQ